MSAPVQVAVLSTGAAVVHFAVIAQHLDEWWLTGVFFIAVAFFQLVWALLVVLRPSVLVYASGAVVNGLVVVTWIVSRTNGIPVGPEAGEVEPVGSPGSAGDGLRGTHRRPRRGAHISAAGSSAGAAVRRRLAAGGHRRRPYALALAILA